MNIIDLELYKWQMHRLSSKPGDWLEYGAFISILPRQSGKTEMLIRMAKILQKENEDFLFVVSKKIYKDNILKRFQIDPKKIEVLMTSTLIFNFKTIEKSNKINLLIDEFMTLEKIALQSLLKMDWKSVSMVGGFRL